jgi:hypothetical protein
MSRNDKQDPKTSSTETPDSEAKRSGFISDSKPLIKNKFKNTRNKTFNSKFRDSSRFSDSNLKQTGNFKTDNLSTAPIAVKFFNQNLISESFRFIQNQVINIQLFIRPDKTRLEYQAQVWARKIISEQELYLRAICSASGISTQLKLLQECYIYSYYKSVLYALSDRRVAEIPEDSIVIKGHSILHNALLRPNFNFEHRDITINYNLDCTPEEYTYILEQARSYDYLNEYLISSTRFSLENEKLDRILNGLSDRWQSGYPEFEKFGSIDSSKVHLSIDNFPIGNSFYTSTPDNTAKFFYMFSTSNDLITESMLFGKACFFHCRNTAFCRNYYDLISQEDEGYLVKYEVSSLASSNYPNPNLIVGK